MKNHQAENQQKILEFLRARVDSGLPPSVREICVATGIKSTSNVHANLIALEKAGLIRREAGHSRAIYLTGSPATRVPLIGRVTAGVPILAVEQIEDYVPFPVAHPDSRELFALRVSGDSMKDAAILDGDIVVAKKSSVAYNRQIVIAMIDEEATVKRYFNEGKVVRLQPENDAYEPIISDRVVILGRVIGCIRSYE